jgi:hypothetical protein
MSNWQQDMAVLLIGGAASGRQEQIDAAPFKAPSIRRPATEDFGLWRPRCQTMDIESIFSLQLIEI